MHPRIGLSAAIIRYNRTDLHEICRIGRTLDADERSDVIFFDLSREVAAATNFVGKIDLQSSQNPHTVVRVTFARAASPTYDKKDSCYAKRRQTNYLIRWTQANQLSNKLTTINRRFEGQPGGLGYSQALRCI